MKKHKFLLITISFIILILIIFNKNINSFVVYITFNALAIIDNAFNLSSKTNPIIIWAVIFALFGTCYGLISASERYNLNKNYKLIGYLLPFLLLFIICLISKPQKMGNSRELFEDSQWQLIKNSYSYSLCSNYIDIFPNGKYISQVKIKREQELWDSATISNSSAVWELYLLKYPNNVKFKNANNSYEVCLWNEAKKANSSLNYENYLSHFPNSRYSRKAKLLIRLLNNQNTITENSKEQRSTETDVSNSKEEQISVTEASTNQETKTTVPTNQSLQETNTTAPTNQSLQETNTTAPINKSTQESITGIQGTYKYADGRKYIGTLTNGIPNGKGKEIFPDNSTLIGVWKNGKREGGFVFINATGTTENQEFRNGNRIR